MRGPGRALRSVIVIATMGATSFTGCSNGDQAAREPEWQPPEGPVSLDLDWERFDRKGRFALRQDQYQEAIELLHRATDLRPRFAPGWDLLGVAYTLAGRPGVGARLIEKAIELDPDQGIFYVHLGKSQMDLTNYQKAREAYHQALEHGAERAKVYYDLGLVAQRQDRLRDAVRHFEDAIEVNEGFDECYYRLGAVHEELGDQASATHWFEKALELQPGHMGAHYSLGLLHLRGDRPDAGKKHMEAFERLKQARIARNEKARKREADRASTAR